MSITKIIDKVSIGELNKGEGLEEVLRNPELLPEIFNGLNSEIPNIKYGCDRILRGISESNPELLYPHFDFFSAMLDNENRFLNWGAIIIISNLARIDTERKFDAIFDKYFSQVKGPVMITAGNIVGNAYKIAMARHDLCERITAEILRVENGKYQTDECKNIVIGHAIDSFDKFFHLITDKNSVLEFVKKQLNNSRNPVKRRAEKFIKKHKIK